MKIVKISAIWCGACLKTNKNWSQLKKNYSFESVELDYDIDEEEALLYQPGNILPVFVFLKDNQEVGRLIGEVSYQDLEKKYLEVSE
ncbi:MAG: thioredoxin family protein [Bacilli bacterium]|nr:thioredoxin family protein [Bacilli bacterium]